MKALEKANAAPPEKRNRFTPRRHLAWYANLSLAHLKLGPPGKRSPTHVYNGLHCRHLEHSLALAGEDKAKLEAHRERFQRAFRPRDREESRFVRGMADCAWRLLRSFGVRSRWEMRAVQFRLLLAIEHRQSGPAEQKLEPEAARRMAEALLRDLGDVFRVYEEQKRLRKRLEELLRAFLTHRMGAPSSFRWFTGQGSRLPDFEHMPDFDLSNPYLWPKLAEELAQQEAAGSKKMKEAKDWAGSGTEGGRNEHDPARQVSDEEKFLRYQILQSTGFTDALDQADLERLLELAFGIDDCRLTIDDCKISTWESSARGSNAANPTTDVPLGGFQSSIDHRQSSISEALWARLMVFPRCRDREARELDETLEQASGPQGVETWEPQPPRGRVPKSGWPREADDQSPHWQWRALAALLLAVFAWDIEWLDQATVLAWELHRALNLFLVWHYQDRTGFEVPETEPERWLPPYWQPGQWGHYLRGQYAYGVRVVKSVWG